MDGKELKGKFLDCLKEFGVSTEDFVQENISPADQKVLNDKVGPYKLVHDERSDDDDHDQWEKVYHFTDHNVYLMVVGSYHSEYGQDFDYAEFNLAEPVEYVVKSFSIIS